MAIKDHSRRKSVAVAGTHGRSSLAPQHRRRAHSGVPGELSPYARSRLSAPFKGILKARPSRADPTYTSSQESAESQSQAQSQAQSQPQPEIEPEAETQPAEEGEATQTMEFTEDVRVQIHDNFAKKPTGPRVSFNTEAYIRFFEKPLEHTNGTGSPQSSPAASSDPLVDPAVNDENAYSRAALAKRRRSSGRMSLGSDMDLTTGGNGALLNESFDADMSLDGDDMDITDNNIRRRRSSGLPSTLLARAGDISDDSINFSEDLSESNDGHTQHMDFTIPLAQALNQANEDPVWLELQRATHAGPSGTSEDDMEEDTGPLVVPITTATEQDQSALDRRMSLGFGLTGNESFSSADEESFVDPLDAGDKTLNLTQVLGRGSLGLGRLSEGGYDSAMDESETYGQPTSVASTSVYPNHLLDEASLVKEPAPAPVTEPLLAHATEPVFRPPPAAIRAENAPHEPPRPPSVFSKPKLAVFTPKPAPKSQLSTLAPRSPPKPAAKPLYKPPPPPKSPHKPPPSAAFALPVARSSPKKSTSSIPAKRPTPQDENAGEGPGASKRPNLGKEKEIPTPPPAPAAVSRPLSPSKRAPFEPSTNTRPTNIKRPSGYFARRRSMATGLVNDPPPEDQANAPTPRSPPKKKAPLGMGRASMASGDSEAWKRFDKTSQAPTPLERRVEEPTRSPIIPAASQQPNPPSAPSDDEETLNGPSNASLLPAGQDEPATQLEMDVEPTEAWRQNVAQEEDEEDDMPAISIEKFFEMTGIKFMDDLKAPRRSMYPSQSKQPRNAHEISLAEYAVALAIDIPQLELYSRVSRDLQAWMEQSRDVLEEAEEEAAKMTPELFVEFARADEEGQSLLLHQLNLIRTNTRGQAKSDWYDWKLQWINGLCGTAEQALDDLETDARKLAGLRSQAEDVIPALQAEYDALMQELEAEQAEVAEIEKCDQEYLSELKAELADQSDVIETMRSQVKEESGQLAWLGERLAEIELEKGQTRAAIAEANRKLQMQSNSTEAEVLRLRDELEGLETLHMFQITKLAADEFEYVHASHFRVRIPCAKFVPIPAKIRITVVESMRNRQRDDFPFLSQFFLARANEMVQQVNDMSLREIVQMLRDYWSSCAQLRMQFKHVVIRFPVAFIASRTGDNSLTADVTVMFPARKAKAMVKFHLGFETYSRWPCSIGSLRHEVDIAYGDLDRDFLFDVIKQVLNSKSPAENYACLSDACIEAQKSM